MAAADTGYFADSSALVKRYVQETGTSWVRRLTRRNPSTVIDIVRITAIEVTSAVARRRKDRTLTSKKAASILHRFRQHLAGRYTVIEITPALADSAMRLANTHSLRAYDAVQLAAALDINQKESVTGRHTPTYAETRRTLRLGKMFTAVHPPPAYLQKMGLPGGSGRPASLGFREVVAETAQGSRRVCRS